MSETISIHLSDFIGSTTLNLFLRRTDNGVLLNAGGDLLSESPASSGRFIATLAESRAGLGTLAVIVCDGAESAANLVWEGWLAEATTLCVDTFPQSAGGGGGGSGDASQTTLLAVQATTTAIAASLAGAPVSAIGRVAAGGAVTLYVGDDCTLASGTALAIPVSDPAGGLYAILSALSLSAITFGASRGSKAASLISGTVVAVAQSGSGASTLCIISVEIIAAGTASGCVVSDDYEYQISARTNTTDDFVRVDGALDLRPRRVAIPV